MAITVASVLYGKRIKAWLRRHRTITWLIFFLGISLLDMPIRLYTQWFWINDINRIEYWFDIAVMAIFFLLAWSIADIVRDRL